MAKEPKTARKGTQKGTRTGKKGKGKTVSQYLRSIEPERRKTFAELQELVSKGLPDATLTMSYGMPTWEVDGPVAAAASQKNYLALYMCGTSALDRHRDAFSHLDVGKGCIRFKRMDDLPLATVKRMLREAAREVAAK